MGLIQSAIEEKGIPTVSVSVAEEITNKVGAPRVLFAPYPFGYPLGEPGNPELQHRIIREALGLLDRDGPPPASAYFDPGAA